VLVLVVVFVIIVHPFLPFELVKKSPNGVIPAKAGIQKERVTPQPPHWIPAFAGMTRGV
jgi:hypothetical protein